MELLAAFKKALEFEKKGERLYGQFSKETRNLLVAKTFKYLAEQEVHHVRMIREYINDEKIDYKDAGDTGKETAEFFNMTISKFKGDLELSDDDIKAHEAALHLEKDAYEFYKKEMALARSDEVKKFLKFMMVQEKTHYELIEKAYDFIKDPEMFFANEERWNFEG